MRVGQLEFPSTVEADPVCAVFDREHTAEVTVPAAKGKLENPKQGLINPALAGAARNFHWRPATPAESERWPELGQSRNPQLRNKC